MTFDIEAARAAGAPLVHRTPVLSAASLSAMVGGTVALKAENLQRTGSFKLRGVLAKLAGLPPGSTVVAGSAGNHGQALAYAARARGMTCEVFVPVGAAISKVAAVRAFGATVHQSAATVDDCVAQARERAAAAGSHLVHPFDDPLIVAGQATLGRELLEDRPDLSCAIVPVGGGGLIAGVALALKRARPEVRVVGVQAEACAAYVPSLRRGAPAAATALPTLADGIAIKRPGELTLPLVQRWVDELVTVPEDAIARAMVLLAERAKLVVEGAGAVGVAALLTGAVPPARRGATVVVLSGGNVDAGVLSAVAHWSQTSSGRRMRLFTRVDDHPGGLAALLQTVADTGANVLGVDHVRDGVDLHVRETGVELTLETRGPEHAEAIRDRLTADGYRLAPDAPHRTGAARE